MEKRGRLPPAFVAAAVTGMVLVTVSIVGVRLNNDALGPLQTVRFAATPMDELRQERIRLVRQLQALTPRVNSTIETVTEEDASSILKAQNALDKLSQQVESVTERMWGDKRGEGGKVVRKWLGNMVEAASLRASRQEHHARGQAAQLKDTLKEFTGELRKKSKHPDVVVLAVRDASDEHSHKPGATARPQTGGQAIVQRLRPVSVYAGEEAQESEGSAAQEVEGSAAQEAEGSAAQTEGGAAQSEAVQETEGSGAHEAEGSADGSASAAHETEGSAAHAEGAAVQEPGVVSVHGAVGAAGEAQQVVVAEERRPAVGVEIPPPPPLPGALGL
eukprot:Hpha_TRINITY_DN29990_c0_g1::TRINITY_DN29990_c0_g1_i1::g.131917::m.131917